MKDERQLLEEWYFNHGDWVDHDVWNGSDVWNWYDDAGKIHETRGTANSYNYPGTFVDTNVSSDSGKALELVIKGLSEEIEFKNNWIKELQKWVRKHEAVICSLRKE